MMTEAECLEKHTWVCITASGNILASGNLNLKKKKVIKKTFCYLYSV